MKSLGEEDGAMVQGIDFGPDYKVQPAPDFYAEIKMLLGESAVA